jgi:hypothetical protein
MNGKIFGVSFTVILVAVIFYLVGVKFPSIGQSALSKVGLS